MSRDLRNRIQRLGIALMAVVLGVSISQSASGQWGYFTELNAAYNTNPIGIHDAEASSVLTLGAGVDYSMKGANIGYLGRYGKYAEFSELDAFTHQGFVTFGKGPFSLSANVEQRLSGESRIYDYSALNGTITSLFSFVGLQWALVAGGRQYHFVELTNRNQRAVLGALRLSRSFSTGTTFIVSVGAGATEYTADTAIDAGRPVVHQVNGTFRVAQSLTPTAGLAAQYQFRSLTGETPDQYVVEEEGISYALLDDPSLYSLESYGIELTKMLFQYRVSVKVGAYYGERDYLTQGNYLDAITYDVAKLRRDSYYSVWLKGHWSLDFTKQDLSLELGVQWVDNASTSFWYAYDDSYLSLGVGYNF